MTIPEYMSLIVVALLAIGLTWGLIDLLIRIVRGDFLKK